MANLRLISSILLYLSKPLIRIYIRNNRLMIKLLCIVVFSVDYQLLRYLIDRFAKLTVSKRP